MLKAMVISVVAALVIALVFWLAGKIGNIISTIISIPTGAVVAFDLEDCPKPGWKEYKVAYGRFVRGIDKSGTNIDPDGERSPGAPQEDEFKSHSHQEHPGMGTKWFTRYKTTEGTWPGERDGNRELGGRTAAEGGKETRPKNVALLFCEKS